MIYFIKRFTLWGKHNYWYLVQWFTWWPTNTEGQKPIIEINITTVQRQNSWLFYKHDREVDLRTNKNKSSKRLGWGWGLTLGPPDCISSALTLNHAACMRSLTNPDLVMSGEGSFTNKKNFFSFQT